jgi:hypothetical protein
MGMSIQDFDKQKATTSRRYYIDEVGPDEDGWRIVDRATGAEVGRDGGEPEDQSLVRDWAWVADALNQVETVARAEVEELQKERRDVELLRKEMREIYDRYPGDIPREALDYLIDVGGITLPPESDEEKK